MGTMASSTRNGETNDGETRLWQEDGWWIAKDVDTGVTTQGESRDEALDNRDDAAALHTGERGRDPTDEELRALGIDPANNSTGDQAADREMTCQAGYPRPKAHFEAISEVGLEKVRLNYNYM